MALPKQNRVAVWYNNRDLRMETRPLPVIGEGELLLEVHASGICGSDLLEWYRLPKAPLVLGHEVAGQVVDVGDDVNGFTVGDRIVSTHHVPCFDCEYCRSDRETMCELLRSTNWDPGGFADFVRVPAVNVRRGTLPLPDGVSDNAASFVEPFGCALRGQRKINLREDSSVLILGSGVSGCLHLLAARHRGAGKVLMTDPEPSRRAVAEQLGADAVFDARDDVTGLVRDALGRGVDVVIATTGARPAIDQALDSVDRGGTILFFAPMGHDVQLPIIFDTLFWRADITLTATYGAAPRDLEEALGVIASGCADVDQLVTHTLPLAEIGKGFEMMMEGTESLKIIVDPRLDRG
jgi:L-iditol 2-dehydrogenase